MERAIAALDAFDGDPDMEDVSEDEGAQCEDEGVSGSNDPDSEPWLGALERGHGGSGSWMSHGGAFAVLDGEEQHDAEMDYADYG